MFNLTNDYSLQRVKIDDCHLSLYLNTYQKSYLNVNDMAFMAMTYLSLFELNTFHKFNYLFLKYDYLVRCIFLKKIFKNIFGIEICEEHLHRNKYGKPFYYGQSNLFQFNISHSTNDRESAIIFVCLEKMSGYEQDIQIGADIELNCCSVEHYEFISQVLSQMNYELTIEMHHLNRYWSIIEALGKCMGKGLSSQWEQLTVKDISQKRSVFINKFDNNEYVVESVFIKDLNHYAYICINRKV
ncbi:4'-phosphopantetheinyl transferase family protein [Marinicellulosiphila megalodicopiae]|uniref:4'-phosphopantetheinyl transferase family protein n=1 Tax=Marinicellulosiphila megalodicopiae TaxID=2724896 RepID=UPI003BAF8348